MWKILQYGSGGTLDRTQVNTTAARLDPANREEEQATNTSLRWSVPRFPSYNQHSASRRRPTRSFNATPLRPPPSSGARTARRLCGTTPTAPFAVVAVTTAGRLRRRSRRQKTTMTKMTTTATGRGWGDRRPQPSSSRRCQPPIGCSWMIAVDRATIRQARFARTTTATTVTVFHPPPPLDHPTRRRMDALRRINHLVDDNVIVVAIRIGSSSIDPY